MYFNRIAIVYILMSYFNYYASILQPFFQVELISNGVNIPVTPQNVYEYVRKYAEHRMLVVAEQPLHVSDN